MTSAVALPTSSSYESSTSESGIPEAVSSALILGEAVQKDFAKNVETAVRAATKRIGAA